MPRPGVCDARTGRDGFDSEPSVFALQVSGTVLSDGSPHPFGGALSDPSGFPVQVTGIGRFSSS